MAGITLAQAEAQLSELLAALSKVRAGQSVTIDGTVLTRANYRDLEQSVGFWDRKVKELSATSRRGRAVTVSPGW